MNFKSQLKEKLSNPNTENLRMKDIYLIDKHWFNLWKKHVGYDSAEKFYNNYKFRNELNDSDYDTLYSIINNNSSNSLFPLDNTRLYNNGKLKLDSEFILVDSHCYKFFSLGSKKSLNQLNKSYEILIFFEKIFLIIDGHRILLIFKEKTNKAHFELLIEFKSINFNKNNFFIQLGKKNIDNWLKSFNFDLFSTKELLITNGPLNINIINKTLIVKEQTNFTQICTSNNNNLESQGKNHKISNEMLQTLASIQKNIEMANELNLTKIEKPNKNFKNILKSNEEKLETTQNFLKKNFFNKNDNNDFYNMNPTSLINLTRKKNISPQNQINFDNINLDPKDKKIKDLEEKINILNAQLSNGKNKYNLIEKENSTLKNKIQQLNNQINSKARENLNLKKEIQEFKNRINSQNNNQINPNNSNTYLQMNNLYKQIIELNEKLKRYPFNLEKGEKMMTIIFSSVDQNICYSIICKNTDTINKLEGELYKEYPQFSETDNYFICKGKVLNKFHTFESNNIKNGGVIVVNQKE